MPASSKIFLAVLLFLAITFTSKAQLCTGSLGDPVVNITFGAGSNPGSPLGSSTTNYTFIPEDCPNDGTYTVRNATSNCFLNHWHNLSHDHTGNPNGYFMLVNASYTPSDFFLQQVDGLCANTTYEFAAWLMNMCNFTPSILPNVTFTIEKTDGTILNSYNSGDIPVSPTPTWVQYGFYFQTPPGITSVVIRMKNNAPGGNGNDIALDDITFRPCGPKVTASINGSSSGSFDLCADDKRTIPISSFISPGFTKPVFQWQLSMDKGLTWQDIQGATTQELDRQPTSPGEYWYRLTVAEENNITISSCRVASQPVTFTVHALPGIKVNGDTAICEGGNYTLNATISYNSPPQRNLTWFYEPSNGLATTSNSQSQDVNNTTTLTYTFGSATQTGYYGLQVINGYGCQNQDSLLVVVHSKPIASFSIGMPICENQPVSFKNSSVGQTTITTYNWNFGDSTNAGDIDPAHTFSHPGNYTTTLVATDRFGCNSDTASKQVSVHPKPEINFGMPKLCLSDPAAQFSDSTVISDHTESSFTYHWNFGDPAANTSNPNTSSLKNPQHNYAATGNYNVSLMVISKDGCSSDTTKVFTLNGSSVKAGFQVTNPSTLCSADSITITDNSSVNFGNIVKVKVYWNYGQDNTLATIDDNPSPAGSYSVYYSSPISVSGEDFTVHMEAYSGINCMNAIDKVIHVNKSPSIEFNSFPNLCTNSSPLLLVQANDTTGINGKGFYSGKGITDSLFYPGVAGTGRYPVTYSFVSTEGCSADKVQPITVYPQPQVNAGTDKTIIKGSWVMLKGSANGNGPFTYSWLPSSTVDNPAAPIVKVNPLSSTSYQLKVTSADGCSNMDTVTVTVVNGLYIPTAFTPNNDGLNDLWRLPVLDSNPNTEVWIFDRWGKMVFHSVGPVVVWDGTFNGKPQPVGTYIYLIDLKSGGSPFKGTLNLIR